MRYSYISRAVSVIPLLQSLSQVCAEPIPRSTPQAQGYVDPEFETFRTLFQGFLDSGEELGSSLSINIAGRDVVNLWGGYADINKTRPWEQNTMVNVWSTTKTLVSLAALTLVDKGVLDVYEKVTTYWPEFGVNGKEDIEIRHLLSHTDGLATWAVNVTIDDLYNTEYAAALLGEQAPLWEDRNVSGYHAITFGYPIGEVIRRVTGKTMKQYIAEEITGPLCADFQIGLAEKDWYRAATLVPPPVSEPPNLDPSSLSYRTFTNPIIPVELTTTPGWREAEIGAANGHASASGVTKVLSAITLGGEVNGHKLLSQNTIDQIFEVQASGVDLVLEVPVTFGIGYGLYGYTTNSTMSGTPQPRIAYWGGNGGSLAIMDLDNKVTLGYVMNKMAGTENLSGNNVSLAYVETLYQILGAQSGGNQTGL